MRWTSQLGRSSRCDALRTPEPRRCAAGQGGFTLLEILIAVMLASMVVMGIATAFLGLVRTNRITEEQQAVDHAVTNYAESLKAAEYLPCGPANPDYDALPGLWVSDRGVDVDVIDVEYWNLGTGAYQDTCPGTDAGTQRLTIRGEWRDRDRQGQIVKRNR